LRSADEEGYKEAEVAGALEFVNAAKNDGQYPGDHPAAHYSALVTSDFIQTLFKQQAPQTPVPQNVQPFPAPNSTVTHKEDRQAVHQSFSILMGCSPQRTPESRKLDRLHCSKQGDLR
jgi:hypothetical protein